SIAARTGASALEVRVISEHELATLLQMARGIYPHGRIADQYYAVAVKGYDAEDRKAMVAEGVAALDTAAQAAGHADYVSVGWEDDRVKLLQAMEDTPFFQTVRGGLVTGLYNQKEVWPIFGRSEEHTSELQSRENLVCR